MELTIISETKNGIVGVILKSGSQAFIGLPHEHPWCIRRSLYDLHTSYWDKDLPKDTKLTPDPTSKPAWWMGIGVPHGSSNQTVYDELFRMMEQAEHAMTCKSTVPMDTKNPVPESMTTQVSDELEGDMEDEIEQRIWEAEHEADLECVENYQKDLEKYLKSFL